jgi:C-terminal processing protease CtpA/Prc
VDTLKSLVGGVMDHDVKIGDLVARDNPKPVEAKSKGKGAFAGKLIVLIDSQSGSAAELFARVVQLEKRGTVIGDQSAGGVMLAEEHGYSAGTDTVLSFGASITSADILMGDGKSLEGKGVIPDEIILPSPADLASGRDPVLVHAAEIAGVKLDPEKAGSIIPFEWPKN